MRRLLLGLLIGAMALPAAAQSVRAGIEAWQKGDTGAAVAIWRPLADKGDADAAFNLGQAYRLGKGVALDLAQAQGWLERARGVVLPDVQLPAPRRPRGVVTQLVSLIVGGGRG